MITTFNIMNINIATFVEAIGCKEVRLRSLRQQECDAQVDVPWEVASLYIQVQCLVCDVAALAASIAARKVTAETDP